LICQNFLKKNYLPAFISAPAESRASTQDTCLGVTLTTQQNKGVANFRWSKELGLDPFCRRHSTAETFPAQQAR